MIVNQLYSWGGDSYELPMHTSASSSFAVIAQNLIGWQVFMEGCLSIEWKVHASTFLTSKQSTRQWIASLVKKLWLVSFDTWDHRCNDLHKNQLSNKFHELVNIHRSIRLLLQINTIQFLPHQKQLLYITAVEIFNQITTFRREWLIKAEIIQKPLLGVQQIQQPIKRNASSCKDSCRYFHIPHVQQPTIHPSKRKKTIQQNIIKDSINLLSVYNYFKM